jgi:hypothetical protein
MRRKAVLITSAFLKIKIALRINGLRRFAPWYRYAMNPSKVSGSSETKTYGKGVPVREHEKLPTLSRRRIFGKDLDRRSRIFRGLQVLFSPPEALFSGKLLCRAIAGQWRASP